MTADRPRFPGSRALRRAVESACGPVEKFDVLGYQLAEWLERGQKAPPATTRAVAPYLAGYLDAAARTGRRWGTFAGLLLGVVLSGLAVLGVLVWTVLG